MAEREIDKKNITVTFELSALSFIAEAFGMKLVEGKIKRVGKTEYEDVSCMICGKEIGELDVGGFIRGMSDIEVCCNSLACLRMAAHD